MNEIKTDKIPISPQSPEKSTPSITFEHLFPNNLWIELPTFNPVNGPTYLKMLMWDLDTQRTRFIKAVKVGQGFAERIDLPFIDKLIVVINTLDTVPSPPEKLGFRTVGDLLKEGERLGGVGIKNITCLSDKAVANGFKSLIPATLTETSQLYDSAIGKVIGILDKKGKPKAYILFKEGNRPKKAKKEETRQRDPVFGKLKPVPITY